MSITPLSIVNAMRENIKDADIQFTQGRCYQLYAMLKELFPQAVAWYEGNHVYTEINGEYYDINGVYLEIPHDAYLLSSEPRIAEEAKTWNYIPDMQRGFN